MNDLKKAFVGQTPYINIDEWNDWLTNNELNSMSWYEYYLGKVRNQKLTEKQTAYILTEIFHDLFHYSFFFNQELGKNLKTKKAVKTIDYKSYEIQFTRKGRGDCSFYLVNTKTNTIISQDIKSKFLPIFDWPMGYQQLRILSQRPISPKPIDPQSPLAIISHLLKEAIK